MDQEWVSLNEFMRRNKMGYESAMKLISTGKVEHQKLNGQYKIKITKDKQLDKLVESLIRENEELKTRLSMISKVCKGE